jgi:hypothetical protein
MCGKPLIRHCRALGQGDRDFRMKTAAHKCQPAPSRTGMRQTGVIRQARGHRGNAYPAAGKARAGQPRHPRRRLPPALVLVGQDVATEPVSAGGLARDCARYPAGRYAVAETAAARGLPCPGSCRPRWSRCRRARGVAAPAGAARNRAGPPSEPRTIRLDRRS